jgi:hypothetical protein
MLDPLDRRLLSSGEALFVSDASLAYLLTVKITDRERIVADC